MGKFLRKRAGEKRRKKEGFALPKPSLLFHILIFNFSMHRREADDRPAVVVLSGLVAADRPALAASVRQNEAALRVRFRRYRIHDPAAVRRPVARVDVEMQGAETPRTMVPRGVPEGRHFPPAVRADKSAVVFRESLVFQNHPPKEKADLRPDA